LENPELMAFSGSGLFCLHRLAEFRSMRTPLIFTSSWVREMSHV
jgi:hypothetical protein